jgi:hypothetical protein
MYSKYRSLTQCISHRLSSPKHHIPRFTPAEQEKNQKEKHKAERRFPLQASNAKQRVRVLFRPPSLPYARWNQTRHYSAYLAIRDSSFTHQIAEQALLRGYATCSE